MTYSGDPEYLIDTWETDQGLPENSATSMVQTEEGYLWFGTFNGLARFDGSKFTVFDPSNTPELPSEGVVSLHLDQSGRMWVSTLRGIVARDSGRSVWLTYGPAQGWTGSYARSFAENAGVICITSFNGKVAQAKGGQLTELPEPPGVKGAGRIGYVDPDGVIWTVQDQYFGRWDGRQWSASKLMAAVTNHYMGAGPGHGGKTLNCLSNGKLLRIGGDSILESMVVNETTGQAWRIDEDSQGFRWICTTSHGLFRVGPGGAVRHYTTTNGLSYQGIRFVFEDREKNIWVGSSGGGLMRFKRRSFVGFPIAGLPDTQPIKAAAEDADGGIMVGAYGNGLARIDKGVSTRLLLPDGGNPMNYIQSLLVDRRGNLWMGGFKEGARAYALPDMKLVASWRTNAEVVSALYEDSRGRVWVGGRDVIASYVGGQFHEYGNSAGVPFAEVRSIAEDPASGNLWAASPDGIFRFDGSRWSEVTDSNGQSIRENLCLHPDGKGAIWVGGAKRALLRWWAGKISEVTAAQGLPVNRVGSIVDDGLGYWWLGSNRGVVRARREELEGAVDDGRASIASQLLNVTDGLPSMECPSGYSSTALKDRLGRLWFATLKGPAMVDPRQINLNTKPPKVVIESLRLEDFARNTTQMPVDGAAVVVPPNTREIAIGYSAPSFVAPEKVRFAYRIDGLDHDWRDVGQRRSLYFFPPSPGAYTFRVKAANNDGFWNQEGASLPFVVKPALSQTVWFRALAGGGLALLTGVIIRRVERVKLTRKIESLEQQRALEEERARLAAVMEATSDLVGFTDPNGKTLYINCAGMRLLGLQETDDVRGRLFAHFCPDWAARRLREVSMPAAIRDGIWGGETALLDRRGAEVPCSQVLVAHKTADGAVNFLSTILRDISEQRRNEESLKKTEYEGRQARQRFEDLIHSVEGIVWEADAKTFKFTFVSDQAERLLGYPCQEWLDQATFWADHIHPEDRDRAVKYCIECTARMEAHQFEYRMVARDGRVVWLRDLVSVHVEDGRASLLRGVMIDITERKRVEDELRASEARKRAMLNAALDCVITIDEDGRVLEFNPVAEKTFGYRSGDVVGRAIADVIIPPSRREAHVRGLAQYKDTKTGSMLGRRIELTAMRAGGAEFPVEASILPVTTDDGKVLFTAYLRDISERKEAEAARSRLELQLRQTHKMEAMGTLASGIAHDFNNILGSILAYTELAQKGIDDRSRALDYLEQVLKASGRAKTLIQQILTFSRQQKQDLVPISLEPPVREALQFLRSTLPAAIQIVAEIVPDTPMVLGDPTQIHQVVMNLCANAAHAMRARPGAIVVWLESCLIEKRRSGLHGDLAPGEYVRLTVQDTGHGMNGETLRRIFDPFFTTKGPGEGTGLGLAVVHGVVKEHRGEIVVQSEEGKGSTFQLYFPAHSGSTGSVAAREAPFRRGAGQSILYVDDEKALAMAVERILDRLGYRVRTESDPATALDVFRAAPESFDLIIVDLNMPKMSGLELASQINKIRPEIPIILATGNSGSWTPERARGVGLRGLLTKPFGFEELGRAIHLALQER